MDNVTQGGDATSEVEGPGNSTDQETEKVRARRFPVIEIFGPTIQGEGPMIGVKTLFIRFGGCDYRCVKCDSMWAVDPRAVKLHAHRMSAVDILYKCLELSNSTGCKWVTLSGGNPCMHQLNELVDMLHENGLFVALETQGTLAPGWIQKCNVVTISPKGPGMGEKFEPEAFKRFMEVLNLARPKPQAIGIKVVVFNQLDLEFALDIERLMENDLDGLRIPELVDYYLSLGNPYPPELDAENQMQDPKSIPEALPMALLREYRMLAEDLCIDPRFENWKFLPQLHVLVWHNESGR